MLTHLKSNQDLAEPDSPSDRPPATPDERRLRLLWWLGGAGIAAVAVLVFVLVVAHDNASLPTPAAATASPVGTTTATTTATTESTALVRTPTDAAQALYFAWQRGSDVEAAAVATEAAAASILAIESTKAAGLAFTGCTAPVNALSACTWSRSDAQLTMTVQVPATGRPVVQTVEFK